MDLQENIYKKVKKTYYMSAGFVGRHVVVWGNLNIEIFMELKNIKKTYYMLAGFAGQHVVSFEDLNINIFLEVQNIKYS